MKHYLVALLFFASSAAAQNNNLLAKVAYENAEVAYNQKEVTGGLAELDKVDKLLGKVTPKSLFLRVQFWMTAAELNPANIDMALKNCKAYLELSKSYDLPEDKQMEVIRLSQKLEKEKGDFEVQNKKSNETNIRISKFTDSLYSLYRYKPGLIEAEFLQYNPDGVKGLKRKKSNPQYIEYESNKHNKTATPKSVNVIGGTVSTYSYTIKAGDKSEMDDIAKEYARIKSVIESTFPTGLYKYEKGQFVERCEILYQMGSISHFVVFRHGSYFGNKPYYLEVSFMGSINK